MTINWAIVDPQPALQLIEEVSSTQMYELGRIVTAVHNTYGFGQFIYLKGVASTAAAKAVVYDNYTGDTTLTVAASRGPVAIAMAATVASTYGFYQIQGIAVATGSSGDTADKPMWTTATGGTLEDSGSTGQKIDGCISQSALDTPSTGLIVVALNYPACNGNG